MKKILKYIICVLLCVTALNLTPFIKVNAEPFDIKSESAILIDFHSQNVIYSKNETEHLTIASMTKIMLLDLCFDALENDEYTLTDEICVSENASGMGGSQVFLRRQRKIYCGRFIEKHNRRIGKRRFGSHGGIPFRQRARGRI